jgi:dehydrogenase/reductase SDR family protein 13
LALAQQGWRVYVAARSREKGEATVAAIKASAGSSTVFFLPLDLADLSSVRSCADSFLARGEPLHVLVNNAGVAEVRGLTRLHSALGYRTPQEAMDDYLDRQLAA